MIKLSKTKKQKNKNRIDFVIVGPQKAGTTWIYEYLRRLPGVCFPSKVKETRFFDLYYEKGLDWYFWHFDNCGTGNVTGEVAPTYFDVPEAALRLRDLNSRMKIVVTLRNPYKRSWSLYLHQCRYGCVKGELEHAMEQDQRIISSSRYATHIRPWLECFGKDQVLVVLHDDLLKNPKTFMMDICEFISAQYLELKGLYERKINPREVSRSYWLAKAANNVSGWLRKYRLYEVVDIAKRLGLKKIMLGGGKVNHGPTDLHYQIMHEHLEPEIRMLEQLIGRDLGEWKRDP